MAHHPCSRVSPVVRLVVPDQRAVCPLEVVDQRRPGCHLAAPVLPHARRAGLPVTVCDRDRVLVHVDGDADTELLAG